MIIKYWDSLAALFRQGVAKVYMSDWIGRAVKKYSSSSWSVILSSTLIPDYDIELPETKYKWGYIALCNNYASDSSLSNIKILYNRIVNARLYTNSVSLYTFTNQSSGSKQTVSSTTTFSLAGYTVPALQIYYADLGLSATIKDQTFYAVEHDYPELNSRWCWYEFENAGLSGYYVRYKATNYLYLPYAPLANVIAQRGYIKQAFTEICSLIKANHDIDYVDQQYHLNNKLYTAEQKIKIAKVIHDYLVTRNNYGTSASPYTSNQETWPALSNYVADPVCISYAKAYYYCCWRWGITCVTIYGVVGYDINAGTNDGNHAWNMCTYEPVTFLDSYNDSSIWNEVDCTWDDPTNYTKNNCRWTYFNITTAELTSAGRVRSTYTSSQSSNQHVIVYPCEASCTSYTKYKSYINGSNASTYLWIW